MQANLSYTLLGTGSSGGVPRVGNQWGQCDPDNPRNRRRRCAMLVQQTISGAGSTTVLIDAGADLREQLLAAQVSHLDAVLLTHSHADHIFGLDDLRQLAISMKEAIPVYMDDATSQIVMNSFGYVFHQAPGSSYPAFCSHHRIEHESPVIIDGAGGAISFDPLIAEHGDIHALGFRMGTLAYLPDMKRISDPVSRRKLDDISTLVVDALRYKPHPSHMHLEDTLDFIRQINPEHAVLTNMHTDLDYNTLLSELPDNVVPGFDGMVISH